MKTNKALGGAAMHYDYKPLNQEKRVVYLDLEHSLHMAWEKNPESQGTDIIRCHKYGVLAHRVDDEFGDGVSAYCSYCMELFDPAEMYPRFTDQEQVDGVKIVTLVR